MKRLALIVAVSAALGGCKFAFSHYRITDPATNKVYYTHNYAAPSVWTGSGAATFTDDISGRTINIQTYEAEKITKAEWERAVKRPAPSTLR